MSKTIEETLEENGKHYQTTVGDSMYPMLKNREYVVEIVKPERELKRYDLPLYKRPSGKYVLHRILKVKKDYYVTCGDNRCSRERVPKEWVVGVMTGYYKKGKYISEKNRRYRFYVHIWCDFFYIRAGILLVKRAFQKLFKK